MKKRFLLIALLSCSICIMAQDADVNAIPGQYIVQLKGGISGPEFFGTFIYIEATNCLSKGMNIWLVKSAYPDLLPEMLKNPSVKIAQRNHQNIKRRALIPVIPDDSLFGYQWNMFNPGHPGADISATEAWAMNHSNLSQMGDTIVVAVIDGGADPGDGFDIVHPDLNFFVNHHEIPNNGIDDDGNGFIDDYHGWNVFMQNDSVYFPYGSAADLDEHATHVSGIAGARGNDTIGVAGVCWGVKILAVNGASNIESQVVEAYDYVLEMRKLYDQTAGAKGAFVVATNSSFGIDAGQPANFPIWCAMYDSLGQYGILSAAATTNNPWNVDQTGDMPTTCPSKWLIAVTNTTSTDHLNGQAGYGAANIDIGAPGTQIVSTFPNASYGYDAGTSMASPHIAGTVAGLIANACPRLLQAYFSYPDSIALLLKSYILNSADPLNDLHNRTVSGGRLNLYHAFIIENSFNCNDCNYQLSLHKQDVICYGDSNGSVSLSINGNRNLTYTYLWSDGATTDSLTNLTTGYYQVTVTEDSTGCQQQSSIWIYQPQQPITASVNVIEPTDSSAGNIIVIASAGHDTLYYALDGGSYGPDNIFVTSVTGMHTVYVKDQSGCVYATIVDLINAGITGLSEISNMKLSPNPVGGAGVLTVNSTRDFDGDMLLSDLMGRVISTTLVHIAAGLQQKPLDVSALADGAYILSLSRSGRALMSVKVLVIN